MQNACEKIVTELSKTAERQKFEPTVFVVDSKPFNSIYVRYTATIAETDNKTYIFFCMYQVSALNISANVQCSNTQCNAALSTGRCLSAVLNIGCIFNIALSIAFTFSFIHAQSCPPPPSRAINTHFSNQQELLYLLSKKSKNFLQTNQFNLILCISAFK